MHIDDLQEYPQKYNTSQSTCLHHGGANLTPFSTPPKKKKKVNHILCIIIVSAKSKCLYRW